MSPGYRSLCDSQPSAVTPDLTARERLVLESIWESCSIGVAARRMGIDVRTAEAERHSLRREFGVSSSVQLVRAALHCGMLKV